eukprot:2022321-Pleurochrysis_carterae.AAC.1
MRWRRPACFASERKKSDVSKAMSTATPANVDGGARRKRRGCSVMRESQNSRPERHVGVGSGQKECERSGEQSRFREE